MLNRLILTSMALILIAALAACGGPDTVHVPDPVNSDPEPIAATADLNGIEWVLASLSGSDLVDDTNITLTFAGGTFDGFAGCNGYGGRYTTAPGGILTISEVERELQLCQTPEGIMQQEETFLRALSNAAAYRLLDDRLEIVGAAGEIVLVFAMKREK